MMKASKRSNLLGTDEIGGGFKTAYHVSPRVASTDSQDDEAIADLYPVSAHPTPLHKFKNARNRIKAIAIAQSRLDFISKELLELADELRYLNPLMAEALDTAWHATDEALEILANDRAW